MSEQKQVVVGAGPVGSAIAALLAAAGHRVVVVSRSGTGPRHHGVERLRLDATDGAALAEVTHAATVIYNAANPRQYHRWAQFWPPLAGSLLAAAERSGAVLATVSNLYAYGPVAGTLSEDLPDAATYTNGRIRAEMTAAAFAAHAAGRVRAVEVRASDYAGAGALSHLTEAAKALVAGRTARVVGDPDQPHSWTGTTDTARTIVAAAADPQAWGRVWHVPTNPPRTQREALTDLAAVGDLPMVKVTGVGRGTLRAVGLLNGPLRAIVDTYYQFDRPFVVDDRRARRHFGIDPTPWPRLLGEVLADVHADVHADVRSDGGHRAA